MFGESAEEVVSGVEVATDEANSDESLYVEAGPLEESIVSGLIDELCGEYFGVVDLIEDVCD